MIRRAQAHEWQKLRDIADDAYAKYTPFIGKKPAPMLADYNAYISDDVVFVYDNGSDILGFAVIIHQIDGYWLETIAVSSDQQGQGIGKALMMAVDNYICMFATSYQLYTNVVMTQAADWYNRLGFNQIEIKKIAGYQRIYFQKILKQ